MSAAPQGQAAHGEPTVRTIALIGARGRMGRFADAWLEPIADLQVVARYGSQDPWRESLAGSGAEIALDFTVAGLGTQHAAAILAAGCHALIGTSGVDPADDARLDELARRAERGCLVIPNFSLGAAWLQRLSELAAGALPTVTVFEQHGPHKRDAPSGTSLETRRKIHATRNTSEQDAPIPIHSARLPGVIANQTVEWAGVGERLRITHQTLGREAFGPGLVLALRALPSLLGMRRGLEALLDWGVPPGQAEGSGKPHA